MFVPPLYIPVTRLKPHFELTHLIVILWLRFHIFLKLQVRTCIDKHSFDLRILTDQESRVIEGTHTRILSEKTRKIQRVARLRCGWGD